jgi:predicted glycoside hydrolase/deacetylase ChbG (UPF0249 family)
MTLKKLGFPEHDRVVIIHTDDIGMCQASVAALDELWPFGLISSASTMVPCAWFPHAAAWCREHPDVDMGVHITLTSEWDAYRWGPLSTCDPSSGMLDDEGYFPRASAPVQEKGDPACVQREMQAQIELAIRFGITPTHIDTHMGTMMHPKFLSDYLMLGLQYRIPAMMYRMNKAALCAHGLDAETADVMIRQLQMLEDAGMPLIDHIVGMPLDMRENHFEYARRAFDALPEGLTHFILHPSANTPELRTIAPDWRARVENLHTFLREDLRAYIKQIGVHVIGYRALKELM